MKFRKTLLVFATSFLATLACAGCGGSNNTGKVESSTGGGNPTSEELDSNDPLIDISGLNDDLSLDADGNPDFDEEVELNLWSIITQPDVTVFEKLISNFNLEYAGMIHITLKSIGHYDYYGTLESTWSLDPEGLPDFCLLHNEKVIEYTNRGYFYALDDPIYEATGVDFDFTQTYTNIDRCNFYGGHRFGIPLDAHGFVHSFRQDIIKKNNLGFDDNTRYIPETKEEYVSLLENARALADSGKLWVRSLNKIASAADANAHAWHYADKTKFYPSFTYSTDPDGLSALYANGGTLCNEDQTEITFDLNKGVQEYITNMVERTNDGLIGESGTNTEMFAEGNTLTFAEGPWWVSQQYTPTYNCAELKSTSIKVSGVDVATGITEEDAADPVYNTPYVASHPIGWWTTDENASSETANSWYGNGHSLCILKSCKSMKKAAAILTFIKWLTQGIDEEKSDEYGSDCYHLVEHCTSGHMPAWKNVYNSEYYQETKNKSVVLKALGDPADIIASEGLKYETVVFNGFASAIATVISDLQSSEGTTVTDALKTLTDTALSTQASLDGMYN